MKIYLLRHGETAYNVDHRYQGVTDIPLSPTGLAALKQADFLPKTACTAELLRERALAAVKRTCDEQHYKIPPHWHTASAANMASSALCRNHPARSPVMPPNCFFDTA